jgi:putative ABC transport system permease protein
MRTLLQDLKYALRSLRKSPGLTAVAVATLALGIGTNAAIFSVVNSILFRPLGYPSADRLVLLWEAKDPARQDTNVVDPGNYLDWRDRARSFDDLAAISWSSLTLTGDRPEMIPGRAVTANFFNVLKTSPTLGRAFSRAEAVPGGPRVIVISDSLWHRRFHADPFVVGRSIATSEGPATIVGVMPASVRPLPWGDEEYWEPFRLDSSDRVRKGRYTMVLGRLRPGVSRSKAQEEMTRIAHGLEREYPGSDTGWGVHVVGLTEQVVGSARTVLLLLLGAASLVLLISAANVASLLLIRAIGRRREFSVRNALGASRWQMTRQGLVEAILLAVGGGAAGTLLARLGVAGLVGAGPAGVPRLSEVSLDMRTLAVTLLVSAFVGIIIGLGVGLHGAAESTRIVTSSPSRSTSGAPASHFQSGLVVGQVALALILLAGVGLLVRSIQKLTAIDPGFDSRQLLTVDLELSSGSYDSSAKQNAFFDRLFARVRGLPGVEGVGAVTFLPLTSQTSATSFSIVGRAAPSPGEAPVADIRIVDPGYFRTMRIPLLRGRAPGAGDRPDSTPVIVINETMARRLWPETDPVGHRVRFNGSLSDVDDEVIGVVGDVSGATLDAPPRPMIYFPRAQRGSGSLFMVVRHRGDAENLMSAIRGAVRQIDRNQPVPDGSTMSARLRRSMVDRRYPMFLLGTFAALALILSAVGLYGVIAYAVTRRTREIGIRIALGAQPAEISNWITAQGLRLVGLGIALGLGGAAIATRALGSLLFGVSPMDLSTLLAAGVGLAGVAVLATAVPARRAARTDPAVAIRED